MRLLLLLSMLALLLRPQTAMNEASAACRLFTQSVLPGLYPYMVLSLMLVSRMPNLSPGGMILLGWGGGSPTGARLLRQSGLTGPQGRRVALTTATMSPMFLLGTLGGWLGSPTAGGVLLTSVLTSGLLTGLCQRVPKGTVPPRESTPEPLSFGEAVESAARGMLVVCGTMGMMRVLSGILRELLPPLPGEILTALMEVTTGAERIACLPLPLALRTALLSALTSFGGAAGIMQNRALYPRGLLSLPQQAAWQGLHAVLSFLLALGLGWLML